ncbi:MAG: phospho-sugar mutase, partial [Opitutales bacterium]|nr:phospho-sugar mutase [Opitutales bacterium]
KGEFGELNDRFFKNLEFATAGMRGRTIGKVCAKSETGAVSELGTPEHAAVGSNNMNDFNVAKATFGLFNYCKKWCDENNLGRPGLVIAHDVRHFSRHFCELAASVWAQMGGDVMIFDGPRSTPQLSYSVIKSKSTAGIVITASHNPACDNGYKVYFSDGAQASAPHSGGITECVNSAKWADVKKYLKIDLSGVKTVEKSLEQSYIKSIADCVIDKSVMEHNKPKIVFTPVHGTGAVLCPEIMRYFGLDPILEESQMKMDPRFPTVKQPNPEYPETLSRGIELMKKSGAECLVATDPDADRMGVAFRAKNGEYRLLTGNMIGALLMDYRIRAMIKTGLIKSPKDCAVIKTFVTTPLQDAVARSYGLKVINTLTGFKWIGAKLKDYQEALMKAVPGLDYWGLPYAKKAELLQKHSTFFVFGGEESYGFLGTDSVRDKDANAAVIMFSEMFASLKAEGKSIDEYLDEIYLKNGYCLEDLKSIYKEGASGAQYIKNFLSSLEEKPLESVCGVKVESVMNFNKDKIADADGKPITKEKFFFYKLANGYSFAIRASGTEPKIKFNAFARESAAGPD